MLWFGFSEKHSAWCLPKERCLLSFNFTWENNCSFTNWKNGNSFFNSFTLRWKENESFCRKYRACGLFLVPLSSEIRVEKFSPSVIITLENYVEKSVRVLFLIRMRCLGKRCWDLKKKSWEERWRPRVNRKRKRCWFNWTTVAFKRSLSRDKVGRK